MRSFLLQILLTSALVVFTACGEQAFEPEYVVGDRDLNDGHEADLFMQHRKGLTYADGTVLTKQGIQTSYEMPEGFAYLNETNSSIIAADNGGKLLIKSLKGEGKEILDLKNRVLSANIQDDLLAIVNVKNEMKIFSLSRKKELYTFSGSTVMAIDVRLAVPEFFEGLIFFPTLDGKVQIYSLASKKMIRTMSVSTQDQFNNIIFFKIIDKKIIAATGSKIYLFGKKTEQREMPIREVFMNANKLIVLRKDGRIVALNHNLKILHERKYPFAYFLGGLAKNSDIYVIEKDGYLLKINQDFSLSLVYQIDFESESFFVGKESFYFSDGYYTP